MSTWGKNLKISIFGESHGPAIGVVIDNLPHGYKIDINEVVLQMGRRAPGKDITCLLYTSFVMINKMILFCAILHLNYIIMKVMP